MGCFAAGRCVSSAWLRIRRVIGFAWTARLTFGPLHDHRGLPHSRMVAGAMTTKTPARPELAIPFIRKAKSSRSSRTISSRLRMATKQNLKNKIRSTSSADAKPWQSNQKRNS